MILCLGETWAMIKAPSKKRCFGDERGGRGTPHGWFMVNNFKFAITTDIFAWLHKKRHWLIVTFKMSGSEPSNSQSSPFGALFSTLTVEPHSNSIFFNVFFFFEHLLCSWHRGHTNVYNTPWPLKESRPAFLMCRFLRVLENGSCWIGLLFM